MLFIWIILRHQNANASICGILFLRVWKIYDKYKMKTKKTRRQIFHQLHHQRRFRCPILRLTINCIKIQCRQKYPGWKWRRDRTQFHHRISIYSVWIFRREIYLDLLYVHVSMWVCVYVCLFVWARLVQISTVNIVSKLMPDNRSFIYYIWHQRRYCKELN